MSTCYNNDISIKSKFLSSLGTTTAMQARSRDTIATFLRNHDVYLFGPTGVGKTTFVNNLQRVATCNYISIGEITRRMEATVETDAPYLKRVNGRLSLSSVQAIVSPYITGSSSYILDGVPRHLDEAEWITAHARCRPHPAVAITLSADTATVADRMQRRSHAADRPETAERIARRLAVYRSNYPAILEIMQPVLLDAIEIDTSTLSPSGVLAAFCERITHAD